MGFLTDLMRQGMDLFYSFTGGYAIAIILLTVAVRVVLLPFTISQIRATQKMQELQPKIKEIQKKYKNDPQRINRETMELWKKHKVNPLAGCLPLLLQFPFLIAFFQVLQSYEYVGPAGFLWVSHLARPDPIGLPVLAAVTTWWQMKITPTGGGAEGSQRMMAMTMPILIGWMSTKFASGLALYWVVSNLFSIAQQYLSTGKRVAAKGESG